MPEFGCYRSDRTVFETPAGCFIVVDAQGRSWLCAESQAPTPDPSKATPENAGQMEAEYHAALAERKRCFTLLHPHGRRSLHQRYRLVSALNRETLAQVLAEEPVVRYHFLPPPG